MASEAVTPPPSTVLRTSSRASSAPGILRSASWVPDLVASRASSGLHRTSPVTSA